MNLNESIADPVRAVVDAVPSMLAYWDRDLRCRFANKSYEQWFGVSCSSLLGSSLVDLLGPKLYAMNEPHIRGALQGHKQCFERVIPNRDGTVRVGLASYLPQFAGDEVIGFVVEVTDISGLHRVRADLQNQIAECRHIGALLRRSEAALFEAQRIGQMGSWHWEIEADIVSWSPYLYVMFGLDPARLPPTYAEHQRLYTPSSWRRLHEAVLHSLTYGEPHALELEYFHSSGRRGWLESRCDVERDSSGEVVGLLGTARDISALRPQRAPAAADLRIARLETALEAATRRNDELEVAVGKAHGLEVVGTLAAGMSHDFNNVLSALTGALQVLKLTTREARSRALAQQSQQAVDRAASLVRQLMDISRVHVPDAQVIELGAVLRACQAFFKTAAGARVALVIEADVVAHAMVDAYQLEVALLNLIINARDAMVAGGTLTLSVIEPAAGACEQHVVGSALVGVRVRDTGAGMSPETLKRSMEPFFSTKADAAGTGLGLPMVQAFARAAGGTFSLESVLGEGTVATLWFPRSTERPPVEVDAVDDAVDRALHGGAVIALIDDDAFVRSAFSSYLRTLGYDVLEMSRAEDAKALIEDTRAHVDLVIADVAMPGLSGEDFAQWLAIQRPLLPIILVTGSTWTAPDHMVAPVLTKPFAMSLLAATVASRLGRTST